jgi:hypothetical protein
MFIVLLDEPALLVFPSCDEAARSIQPADAESEIRAAFDDEAVPYRVEWIRPNRYGQTLFGATALIEPGEYRFVPDGPTDPAGLVILLEDQGEFVDPPDARPDVMSLLRAMRAIENVADPERA